MGKKNKIFIIFILLSTLFFIIYEITHNPISLSFNQVTTFDTGEEITNSDFAWISLISDEYAPMWNSEYISNKYGIEIEDYIDTENFSYIVTFGHELKSISYCYSDARTKYFGIIPKEKTGKVVLSNEQTSKIYLYQIKKIDIVHDYYGNGENMVIYE